jgi:hypothetical protein
MATNKRNARFKQSEQPASGVFDNGRRGDPIPGCDCVQCFGYCITSDTPTLGEWSSAPRADAGPRVDADV